MPPARKAPARRPSPKKSTRKPPATKPRAAKPTGKAAPRAPPKAAAKPTKGALVKTKKPAPAKPAPSAAAPAKAPARRRPAGAPPVEKTRVVIPIEAYEPQKDAIKAPFRAEGMTWNFLGQGKGLYKRPDGGVHCFTQFKDDGVHYSVWGDDRPAVERVLAAWRGLLGEAAYAKATAGGERAAAVEQEQKESEALRLWRLGEPQRRPGEPDFFFEKRRAEWEAKRPA